MNYTESNIKLPATLKDLAKDYSGLVIISDIDKTYLATQIESIGGLLKTAFETAEAKDNIPGFPVVLRALRRGAGAEPAHNPIFFVSASPPQMRQTLLSKMAFDGIEHNGIVFKDQLEHVRNRHFKKLREQIGYKLEALLALWLRLPQQSKLLLFGDDSESDPIIYSLFIDIVGGVIRGQSLKELLSHLGVFPEEQLRVSKLVSLINSDLYPVEGVFINLVSSSNPNYYNRFGPHFYATENSLQIAMTLYEKGWIRERAVRSIGRELILHYDFSQKRILESLEQGTRRGLFTTDSLRKLWPMLATAKVIPAPDKESLFNNDEGDLTHINKRRWIQESNLNTLNALKLRYTDEGRY